MENRPFSMSLPYRQWGEFGTCHHQSWRIPNESVLTVIIMCYLLFAKYDYAVWNFVGREEKLMNIKQFLFLIPIHRTIPYNFLFMLQVSPRLQGFLDMMLVREPSQRAKAFELLQHAFLRGADKPSCLIPLMRSFRHSPCWAPRPCA